VIIVSNHPTLDNGLSKNIPSFLHPLFKDFVLCAVGYRIIV
jgi:hypothetical protein